MLLSANQANLWEDSSIIVRNDLISSSGHHIPTIRKKNRIKYSAPDPSLKPGQILCLDIVKNPAKCSGLTQDTTFCYYLLLVSKFSWFPFLVELQNISASTIILALQHICTQLINIQCFPILFHLPEFTLIMAPFLRLMNLPKIHYHISVGSTLLRLNTWRWILYWKGHGNLCAT